MEENKKEAVISVIKGTVLSVLIAFFSIFIFAIIVNKTNLKVNVIKAVNQFIKVIAVFIGCVFNLKDNNGLIKGGILGILFTLFMNLLFLIIGNGNFGGAFWIDLAFTFLVGLISGIIAVNVKRK